MNRIERKLQEQSAEQKKACITYITAGLPDMEHTKEIVKAQERGGCDIVELGVPFSDPIADGPIIQQASYEAIQKGATLEKAFQLVKELREEKVGLPLVFMMYYNQILYYGVEKFVKTCIEVGVDGLILPDLPFEEQEEIRSYLEKEEEAPILIQLVSPVSRGRLPMLLKGARGFVYCVSSMGVTGQSGSFHKEILNYLKEVKEQSEIPVMMGFGIKTAEDVAPMKDLIDGAIVGSHFIQLMREHDFDPKVAEEYCRSLKQGLNA